LSFARRGSARRRIPSLRSHQVLVVSNENGKRDSCEDIFRSFDGGDRRPPDDETGWELVGAIVVLIVTLSMIAAANFYDP
jgi:hypothetical protein